MLRRQTLLIVYHASQGYIKSSEKLEGLGHSDVAALPIVYITLLTLPVLAIRRRLMAVVTDPVVACLSAAAKAHWSLE